ncbi:hypothetical protein GW17_00027563 [Ensete ventricosum]|nr:hypothetical protein GW17_00027563 [Ensete ventricosum]
MQKPDVAPRDVPRDARTTMQHERLNRRRTRLLRATLHTQDRRFSRASAVEGSHPPSLILPPLAWAALPEFASYCHGHTVRTHM